MTIPRLAVLALLLASTACGRIDPSAELSAAKADIESADRKTAVIRLSNVLQSDPTNVEARVLRGQLALWLGDYPAATRDLEKAQLLGAEPTAVTLQLAEALWRAGDQRNASRSLDAAAADLESESQYWLLRAEILIQDGAVQDAAEALDRASELGAEPARYLMGAGRVAALRGDRAEAEAFLSAAVQHAANDPETHVALGRFYVFAGRTREAAHELGLAADLFRTEGRLSLEVSVLQTLAELHVTANDLDAASVVAEQLRQSAPQSAVTSYVQGYIEYRRGRFAAAAAALQTALNSQPDDPNLLTLLGAVHLAQGNLGQAEQQLQRVLADRPHDAAAIKLLAETRLRQQRPDAALDALQALASTGAEDPQVGLLTGLANVTAGNPEQGILDLERAAALDPGDLALQLELAKTYVTVGRHADASRLLSTALSSAGGEEDRLEARLVQLLAFVRSGDIDGGRKTVAQLLAERASDPRALVAAAMFHGLVNERREALQYLEAAVDVDETFVPARLLIASELERIGRSSDAQRHLHEALANDPANIPALIALAQLAAQRSDWAGAERFLLDATVQPGAVKPRLMLAQLYVTQGRLTEARQRVDEGAEARPRDPEVTAMRGVLALAEGRAAEAAALLTDANDRLPLRVGVILALSEAHIRNSQPEQARRVLARALENAPESLPLRAALGVVQIRLGDAEAAWSIAKSLQADYPAQSAGYLLEGDVAIARRDYEAAAHVIRVAYERESTRSVLMRLVGALQLAGLPQDTRHLLEVWLSEHPDDVGLRLALANHLQQLGRDTDAMRHYDEVLRLDGENIVALNNSAWIAQNAGNPSALPLAERAYALAPDSPAVLDTLGSILLRQNREQDAIVYLERAAELAPDVLEIRYHLAESQAGLGQISRARATLESLLSDGQPFAQRAAAQRLLDSL